MEKSETKLEKAIRYAGGGALVVLAVFKMVLTTLWEHAHLLCIAICIVSMLGAINAFDVGAINYITMALFVLILAVLIFAMIKIMLLEGKQND